MMRGKVPTAFTKEWSGEQDDFSPPWEPIISMRVGHARLKKWSELLLTAAVGFAIGAFAHLPMMAKFGVIAASVAIGAVISLLAARSLTRAIALQHQAISAMKIKDLGKDLSVVNLETGEVTPPKTEPEKKE